MSDVHGLLEDITNDIDPRFVSENDLDGKVKITTVRALSTKPERMVGEADKATPQGMLAGHVLSSLQSQVADCHTNYTHADWNVATPDAVSIFVEVCDPTDHYIVAFYDPTS